MFGTDDPESTGAAGSGEPISLPRPAEQRDERRVFPAPSGSVWMCEDPRPGGAQLGEIVDPQPGDLLLSESECVCAVGGVWCRCRLVSADALGRAARARRGDLSGAVDEAAPERREGTAGAPLRARLGGGASEGLNEAPQDVASSGEDARTLAVDYDGQGERHKPWKQFCKELGEVPFSDWPLEGPRTMLHLAKHMDKHGRTPTAFLERWCRAKRVEDSDRVQHELRTLVDCLELLGTYDQVNIANLAGAEVLARRLQTVFDAYELNPQRPNYEAARYFSGMGTATDAVAPELRSYVAKKARDEAELEKQRQKARELRAKAPPQGGGKPST